MKEQDEPQPRTFYDVYIQRGTKAFFSRRYLTERGAKVRCKELDDVWGKVGYKTHIEPVEIKPPGPEI